MSSWVSLKFEFSPFEPLREPLQGALSILQTVEAILESLLGLLKAFTVDLSNPIKALVAILLASIRAIINQIESSAISVLLVHPDFSAGDFDKTIQSVSGGYRTFETKVFSKFFDNSDIYRPQYPPGSVSGMLVFYIGLESPSDLMQQLMALLQLIRYPKPLTGLPAPVGVKATPVFKGSDGVAQLVQTFEDTFTSDLDKSIALEWKMPSSPSAAVGPTFVSALTNFVQSFKFSKFIIERSDFPTGEEVLKETGDQIYGPAAISTLARYNFPLPVTKAEVREYNGNAYKHFAKKFDVSSELGLLTGQLTGTYRYVDDDDELIPGKNYWYRIRAYFGTPTAYLNAKTVDDVINSNELIKYEGKILRINYGDGVVMGDASTPVRGYSPRSFGTRNTFNILQNVYDAIKAGLLLNFEFPAATGSDSVDLVDQKIGWGSLGLLSGQVAPLKATYRDSKSLQDGVFFIWAARQLSNQIAASAHTKPEILNLIETKWNAGVSLTVYKILDAPFTWKFIGIKSGITPAITSKINTYLSLEEGYGTGGPFDGPYPVKTVLVDNEDVSVSTDERQALADFLELSIGVSTSSPRYLQWYSLSAGDMFPAVTPFLSTTFRLVQDLLKAMDSILKEINDIIENLISKIQQLETIIVYIAQLIDLFNVNVRVSVLFSTGSSASDLADRLMKSENKPGSSPFGLHSGIVMCSGGPGQGFLTAFQSLGFILGGNWAS